ncbi:MAG: STAS domain-containing protein [bacterium]
MKVTPLREDYGIRIVFEATVVGENEVDVDLESSPILREVLLKLTNSEEKAILVDLERVKYMDSSGIATLVEALQKVKKYQGQLKIVRLRDAVRNVFELSRLDKVFDIYKTVQEATEAF